MSIPRVNQTNRVLMSIDRQTCRGGYLGCTIEDQADEGSGEPGLLIEVQKGWNFWSIRVVGPWVFLGARHGSGMCERGESCGIKGGVEELPR